MKPKLRFLLPAALFAAGATFAQGPLTPPPGADPNIGPVNALTPGGAPQATMKTLHQVEPRTAIVAGAPGVTQNANGGYSLAGGGSYYLTGRLVVNSGSGIIIGGSRVTVDLNGFDIFSGASGVGGYGVEINQNAEQVVIKNGIIKSGTTHSGSAAPYTFTPHGFAVGIGSSGTPKQVTISELTISGCAGDGIYVELARVDHSQAVGCSGTGIRARRIAGCEARENGGDGIIGGAGVCDSVATANSGTGISLYEGMMTDCAAAQNQTGFYAVGGISLSHCTANRNRFAGFDIDSGTLVGCAAYLNTYYGFYVRSVSLSSCVASYNRRAGIHGHELTVSDCTANDNGEDGVAADRDGAGIRATNSMVKGCNAFRNYQNGIYAPGGFVTACRAGSNSLSGGAGWSNIFTAADDGWPVGSATNNF